MRFAKYHGIGNDFIMIADLDEGLAFGPDLVRRLCDRRFGIGADGVIRVGSAADGGDFFMDYVNSDGSIGEMCGNGIRCLALFVRDEGLSPATDLKVATRAGIRVVALLPDDRVLVDMGAPIFTAADIPVVADDPLNVTLEAGGRRFDFTCLSMGNPHAVAFVDDLEAMDLEAVGPAFEAHAAFPKKANVPFVQVESDRHITMKVWERGAGATLACGTGACAGAVAARLRGAVGTEVTVSLPGGDLEISWEGTPDEEAPVMMTGPAVRSFDGEVDPEAYR